MPGDHRVFLLIQENRLFYVLERLRSKESLNELFVEMYGEIP